MNDEASTDNPYESPKTAGTNPFGETKPEPDAAETAKNEKFSAMGRLFIAWERLRVIYNIALAVLAVPTSILIVLGSANKFDTAAELAGRCIFGFFAANFCFLLGHYVNAWLMYFGVRGKTATILIFWTGVGISMPLVLLALLDATGDLLP